MYNRRIYGLWSQMWTAACCFSGWRDTETSPITATITQRVWWLSKCPASFFWVHKSSTSVKEWRRSYTLKDFLAAENSSLVKTRLIHSVSCRVCPLEGSMNSAMTVFLTEHTAALKLMLIQVNHFPHRCQTTWMTACFWCVCIRERGTGYKQSPGHYPTYLTVPKPVIKVQSVFLHGTQLQL